jgi:Transposase, Mutator family
MQHRKSQAVEISGWHGIGESRCSAKPPRSPLMSCRASGQIMTQIQLSQSGISRLACAPLLAGGRAYTTPDPLIETVQHGRGLAEPKIALPSLKVAAHVANHFLETDASGSTSEGAKFWLQVLTELQNRGLRDIFIACVDGLKGFPQAIETVYPKTTVQLCIVHMVRASLNYVNWKERKLVARDLKSIYRAATLEEAERQLASFAQRWDQRYPSIRALWRRNWLGIIPFFQFPPEIRKIVYTTNAIESLNMSLRKAIKTRGAFPSEEAALKVMYLALRNLAKKWDTVQGWKEALNRFGIVWEARFPRQGL